MLSQTRAGLRFSAIPQGTHRIQFATDGVIAEGFAGPTGTGVETAYLRWRTAEVTYELTATLGTWLSEADLRSIAAALIRNRVQSQPE
jgi:hypothetical protein